MKVQLKKNYLALVVFAFCLAFAACGGDGGGDNGDNGGVTDTTPPTVTSTFPVNFAVGVSRNSTITATFSEEINPSTVSTASFSLSDGSTNVAGSVSYDSATKTATFSPTPLLAKLQTYTATITADIADLAGNKLANVFTWSFTADDQDYQSCTVSWAPNREKAVNSAGGGYTVYYSNNTGFDIDDPEVASIDVPYVSGPLSPTETSLQLSSGTWYFRVRAYSALNSGSASAASAQQSVVVP